MTNFGDIGQLPPAALFIIFLWSLLWKGLALWRSAGSHQKIWFIAMLILNTVGILEIVYLFGFATKKMKPSELMFWQKVK